MPLYDYKCLECGREIEVNHPMVRQQAPRCPSCDLAEMTKKFSAPNVTWGGLRPSQGELHPDVKEMISGAEKRRDNETPHQSNRLAEINRRAKHG